MATEELLKLIQEDPMGYEGYLAYAKYLETINLKQAYLTYENALYFCDDETMKKTIQSKLDEIAYRNGKVEPASIVILCYNNRPLTQQCIESIRETTPEFAREIVIVDNNSQDDSVDYLRQQKDIVLIENDYNAGFPGGCNIGIEAAKPENDIFLLNSDTIMCFNTLYTLRMGLYEKDNYGSAGCVTNNCANNQSVFKSESLDELKEFGRNNNIPNKRSEIKLMLIGFALIVKRKVLEKVGYLDERFNPGNFEDDDLSLRILMNNYQNVLVYNSFLIHLGSVSFNNADYFNLLHKNMALAKLTYALSLFISSGYPLEETIQYLPSFITHKPLKEKMEAVNQKMQKENCSFMDAFSQAQVYSGSTLSYLSIGLRSGKQEEVLKKLVDLYENQVDESTSKFINIIEPTIVTICSLIVGIILLSIMLPLMGIMSSIS